MSIAQAKDGGSPKAGGKVEASTPPSVGEIQSQMAGISIKDAPAVRKTKSVDVMTPSWSKSIRSNDSFCKSYRSMIGSLPFFQRMSNNLSK